MGLSGKNKMKLVKLLRNQDFFALYNKDITEVILQKVH